MKEQNTFQKEFDINYEKLMKEEFQNDAEVKQYVNGELVKKLKSSGWTTVGGRTLIKKKGDTSFKIHFGLVNNGKKVEVSAWSEIRGNLQKKFGGKSFTNGDSVKSDIMSFVNDVNRKAK